MENKNYNLQRFFLLGSEWVYFKFYMGSSTIESSLIELLHPLINDLVKKRIIDKWFFVNYNDPNRHLRIRFHLIDHEKNIGYLISNFYSVVQPLVDNYLIYEVQTAIYKREIERYGYSKIEHFETLFYENSELVVNMWKLIDSDEQKRWLYALKCIDFFLSEWGYKLEDKINFCSSMDAAYSLEMKISKPINQNLSKKFRMYRDAIESVFINENKELEELLEKYKSNCEKVLETIIKDNEDSKKDYLESYIHMFCNRVFLSKQRVNEWVLYHFLSKYYNSEYARNKYSE